METTGIASPTLPSATFPSATLHDDDRLRVAVDLAREADLQASEQLLRLLSDVLDIRQVFPEVSKISQSVLAHDRLTMTFHDGEQGSFVMHASSNDDGPTAVRASGIDRERLVDGFYKVIDDLTLHAIVPDVIYDP